MDLTQEHALYWMLVEQGLITEAQHAHAMRLQQESISNGGARHLSLGAALVRIDAITVAQDNALLAQHYEVEAVDLDAVEIMPEALRVINPRAARHYRVLPLRLEGGTLVVAMHNPRDIDAIKVLEAGSGGKRVIPLVASEVALESAFSMYFTSQGDAGELTISMETEDGEEAGESHTDAAALERESADAPIVRYCNLLLRRAIEARASDIHLEPYEKEVRVRFRIDGTMYAQPAPLKKHFRAIVSRLKIMGKLNITERRVPQDGRVKCKVPAKDGTSEHEISARISVIPVLHGEKVVIRLYDRRSETLRLGHLGLSEAQLQLFDRALKLDHGIILATGPTGSGKTTTLYAMLNELNDGRLIIATAEDPAEMPMLGVAQTEATPHLDFADILRSLLRQDPDVIMVGEMRDQETAEIAVRSALTGHLVLSTIHTNNAPATVTRLVDMGIAPFLLAATLRLIIAQRLVRLICTHCRVRVQADGSHLQALASLGVSVDEAAQLPSFRGAGCERCNHSGYFGRRAIYEMLFVSEAFRQLVHQGASELELREAALHQGMITLVQSSIALVREGLTTAEEVAQVVSAE